MTFNLDRFRTAKLVPRTSTLKMEALAPFFGDGEPAEWTVRGLSAGELFTAKEAEARNTNLDNVVAAITSRADQVKAIRESLGLIRGAVPGELARRLEMLVAGSVNPQIELPDAVRLAEAFPIEFIQLTTEITVLTGKGYDMAKPVAASPPIKTSAPA